MSDEHPDAPSPPPGPPPYPSAPPPSAPPYPGAPPPYAPPPTSYPPPGGGYYPPGGGMPPAGTVPPDWMAAVGPNYGPLGQGVYPGASPYASYWARVGGFLIDGVIIFAVSAVILALDHGYHMHTANGRLRVAPGTELVLLLLGALYASLLIGLRGQTVGMMAVRIKAVDANTGGLIGFWRALGRDLFERLLVIVLFIPWLIDVLFPAWDPMRQTLHDKVVSSVVIKV